MSRRCERKDAAAIERKAKRRRERRCFWSWPLGHCMHLQIDSSLTLWGRCCRCGKDKVSFPSGGPFGIPKPPDEDAT